MPPLDHKEDPVDAAVFAEHTARYTRTAAVRFEEYGVVIELGHPRSIEPVRSVGQPPCRARCAAARVNDLIISRRTEISRRSLKTFGQELVRSHLFREAKANKKRKPFCGLNDLPRFFVVR